MKAKQEQEHINIYTKKINKFQSTVDNHFLDGFWTFFDCVAYGYSFVFKIKICKNENNKIL